MFQIYSNYGDTDITVYKILCTQKYRDDYNNLLR